MLGLPCRDYLLEARQFIWNERNQPTCCPVQIIRDFFFPGHRSPLFENYIKVLQRTLPRYAVDLCTTSACIKASFFCYESVQHTGAFELTIIQFFFLCLTNFAF